MKIRTPPLSSGLRSGSKYISKNVIKRSQDVGIEKILTICTTIQSYEKIIRIINENEIVFGTFGIHPHEVENDFVSTEIIKFNIKQNKKIIGIGLEILDVNGVNVIHLTKKGKPDIEVIELLAEAGFRDIVLPFESATLLSLL